MFTKLADKGDVTDSFVKVYLDEVRIAYGRSVDNDLNPKYNEQFNIDVCHFANELIFQLKDEDHVNDELIGNVSIPTAKLVEGKPIEGWFPIVKKKSLKKKGQLRLKIVYQAKDKLEKTYEVPCYFPMHQDCKVTLYQDAYVPPGLPQFANLPTYPASCWKDVHQTLMEAKQYICITGWGFWTEVQLVRGQSQDTRTLGQILVDKVKEGVKVWVMVWKEMTTKEWGISEGYSLMGTHDVETFKFFENTGVHCFLAPR